MVTTTTRPFGRGRGRRSVPRNRPCDGDGLVGAAAVAAAVGWGLRERLRERVVPLQRRHRALLKLTAHVRRVLTKRKKKIYIKLRKSTQNVLVSFKL